MPIAIVIDTDIVRAASNSSASYAKLCADILEAMRSNKEFILALSKELEEEWSKQRSSASGKWDKYISVFAYFWWSEMKARRRVKMYTVDYEKGNNILRHFNDEVVRRRVQKDLHIVLTALSADKRLISGNIRERNQFQRACSWTDCLAGLLWPAPVSEDIVDWLNHNAPREPKYLVCN